MKVVSKYSNVGRYKIHYLKSGKGKPLVFLHSAFGNAKTYTGLIEFLAQQYTVLVSDFPGFGKSDPTDGYLTFESSNKVIAEWIRSLKFKNIILAGNSLGGLHILQGLQETDDRIKAYLLISPYAGIETLKMSRRYLKQTALTAKLINTYCPQSLGNKIWNSDYLAVIFLTFFRRKKVLKKMSRVLKILRVANFKTFIYNLDFILNCCTLPPVTTTTKPAIFIMSKNEDTLDYKKTITKYRKYFPNLKVININTTRHFPSEPLTTNYFKKNYSALLSELDNLVSRI